MLKLRRGRVVAIEEQDGRIARLVVRVEPGGEQRPAIAYPSLTGTVAVEDEVVVNTEAVDLQLGSGGFDIVHVNLSRLASADSPGDHVMKLNYTSLQHAVEPIEHGLDSLDLPLNTPAAVIALHGQLACVAYAFAEGAPGRRLGYVQSAGGSLAGGLSDTVAELLDRRLLCGHVTAGPCFGGQYEAITAEGAIDAAARKLSWDAMVVGPGPGIIGSESALGHGGMAALSNANAALALGCRVIMVPRISSGDPRDRHRGTSHHTRTVLELLSGSFSVAGPDDPGLDSLADGYLDSELPATTMGRSFENDRDFFLAALAGGAMLAREL